MHKKNFLKKSLVLVIIILFFGAGVAPCINGTISKMSGSELNKKILNQELPSTEQISNSLLATGDENSSSLVFHTFDETGEKQQNVVLPKDDADKIIDILEELKYKIVYEPRSEETQALKNEFVDLLDAYGLIPAGLSKSYVLSLLNPSWLNNKQKTSMVRTRTLLLRSFTSRITEKIVNLQQIFKNRFGITILKNFDKNTMITPSYADTATATFCSISSAGNGATLPLFLLPRPRGVAVWSASLAVTLVGELLTGKGFTAGGAQTGTALGFMGLGLTYAFPGYTMYGFVGYALYTKVSADFIEFFEPPNQAPIISDENPSNAAVNVPVTINELSFRIMDTEGEKMDYTVTTVPNIGSGSGQNKNNGVYSVSVSGIEPNTIYTWHVEVSDGYNTAIKDFIFTTEHVAPVISDPNPEDNDYWVSPEITQLSFRLYDNQGDLMDYTVQTDPYIGQGSGTNVGNGIYTVDISGLEGTTEYTWTVEATDGTYWTEEVFNFKTQPIMVFDPFDEGWQYRKKITINHDMVDDDLTNFPALVNVIDNDLKNKAQNDGDDILFMDGVGVATRLLHEIEYFDGSSGELFAWVNILDISSSVDTDFYIYYGNPTCANQQYPENVWDTNYIAVYHMDGSSYTDIDDSTSNNLHVVEKQGNPVYQHTGKVGFCVDFDDDSLNVDDSDLLSFTDGSSNDKPMTLEAWIKCDTSSGDYNPILSKYGPNGKEWLFFKHKDVSDRGMLYFLDDSSDGGINRWTESALNVDNSGWNYFSAIYNGDETGYGISFILDGIFEEGEQFTGPAYNGMENTNAQMRIGAYYDSNGGNWYYWQGLIDEVRISNIARSTAWLKTSYNTMNDPSNFLSFGPEET